MINSPSFVLIKQVACEHGEYEGAYEVSSTTASLLRCEELIGGGYKNIENV